MPRGRPRKKKPEPEVVQAEDLDNSGEGVQKAGTRVSATSKAMGEMAPAVATGKLTSSFDAFPPSKLDEIANEMLIWFSEPKNLWLKDFAILHGMDWKRFERLSERSEKFRNALRICKDIQESKLFKLGLSKAVASSMPIFALKNTAGWRDVKNQPHDDMPIPDGDVYEQIAKTLEKLGLSVEGQDPSRGSLTDAPKNNGAALPKATVGVDDGSSADQTGDTRLESDSGVQEAPVGRDSESDKDNS